MATHLAFQGLAENEIGCARISIVAKSTNALFTGRIRSARPIPSIAHFRLATHGRSIQMGHLRRVRSTRFSGVCPVLPESDSYDRRASRR